MIGYNQKLYSTGDYRDNMPNNQTNKQIKNNHKSFLIAPSIHQKKFYPIELLFLVLTSSSDGTAQWVKGITYLAEVHHG